MSDGFVFKGLDSTDLSLKIFKVFKNWSCDESNYDTFGISLQIGISGSKRFYPETDVQNSDGSYQKLVWKSIKYLYYPSSSVHLRTNPLDITQNYIDMDKIHLVSRSLEDSICVVNIPHRVFGERIKPTSVYLSDENLGYVYIDDGNYNLYISGTDNPRVLVGNVFYESGHIVISTSSYYELATHNFELYFQGTQTITEYEIICTALESEFNNTLNPSAQEPGTNKYIPLFSSSEIPPLVTAIGLYNDHNELVMVGKLGAPFKRDYDLDTTFIIRLDV